MNILERIKTDRLYFDGGTGSELIKRGLGAGVASEEANFLHPEWVRELHRAYIDAGANIIKTNTFGVNCLKHENYKEYIERAVSIANEARGGREDVFIALDIGPLGRMLAPFGDLDFSEAVEIFAKTVRAAEGTPVDLILIETMSDSYETKAAVLAAKENSFLPIFVTNVYDGGGKTMTGSTPEVMANMLEGLGVSAIGANCSFGPREMLPVAERLVNATDLPVIINPNAGLPQMVGGRTVYTEDAESFSDLMVEMCNLGVQILGGCCGTTPEHIRRTKDKTEGIPLGKSLVENPVSTTESPEENPTPTTQNPNENITPNCENSEEKNTVNFEIQKKKSACISSAYTVIPLGEKPLLIGERINPTGKRWLKEELLNNRISKILAEAVKQEEYGISAVDVNCGLPNLDEKAKMRQLVHEIQSVISLPLVIDSSSPEVIEEAVRIYNGSPLINSVNGSEESLGRVLPIAKKYGGALICLTMDEQGIPATVRERLIIAEKILDRAEKLGIDRHRLLFDPLALSVSTDEKNAEITLSSIRELTARGLYSSLGVSNISFGMPNREEINSAFFRLALAEGLSAAIMNPESEEMMRAYREYLAARKSGDTLTEFKSDAEKRWKSAIIHAKEISLSGVESLSRKISKSGSSGSVKDLESSRESSLMYAIIKGLREEAAELSGKLLTKAAPMEIIEGEIIPALTAVGEAYDKKEIFLPGLLLSAEAAAASFDVVKAKISKGEASGGRIIMATVKGDIHDIGKNIVRVVLESWGFSVVDLGRDVPADKILEELEKEEALLVGLSALMTTTLPAMEVTVRAIKERFPKVKVMVGGAVLTADYAEKIGADFYGKDAPSAAKIANALVGRSDDK